MKIKRLFLFLIPLLLVACARQQFQIDGIFTADDGTPVWLIDAQQKDTLSRTEVSGGRFLFKGIVEEPFFAYVGNGKQRVHLILEAGSVTVDIDERVSSGTPMEDRYAAFHRRFYGFGREQREEKSALADSVVRANPDNLVGALALEDLAHVDKDRFLALYPGMSEEMQRFYLLKQAYDAIGVQEKTAPGQFFTDYLVPGGNPDGTDVHLSDYVGRGKYILLDHWASWCGPCKAEMPYIRKTWEAFHGECFEVVGIAVNDKRENTLQALRDLDMPWPQILDGKRLPIELYGVNAIPHLILFGPDGTILRRGLRGEEIYSAVAELFATSR